MDLFHLTHLEAMKQAKDNNVKVILSGEGADEIFTGYEVYADLYAMKLNKRYLVMIIYSVNFTLLIMMDMQS